MFGCFDRVTEDPLDEHKEIRLCNWIRFLRTQDLSTNDKDDDISLNSDDSDNPQRRRGNNRSNLANRRKQGDEKVNLVARFVNGKPQFETIQRVEAGTELFVYFDIQSINSQPSPIQAFPTVHNLSHFSHLNNFDLIYASKHFNNLYASDVVKIKQEFAHPFTPDGKRNLFLSKLNNFFSFSSRTSL